MSNLYRKFRELIPEAPLLVGTVLSDSPARIQLPDGTQIAARGEATLGQAVFVRDGVIEGAAPALPTVLIDV